MRKLTFIAVALCLLVTLPATTAPKKTKKKTTTTEAAASGVKQPVAHCPKTLADCQDDGCSTTHAVDGNLNRRKNITADDPATKGEPESQTLAWMKGLANPAHFVMGGPRSELQDLGEGKKVRVAGFLLTAKQEGGESCNCELDDHNVKNKDVAVNTDNHLVLVSGATVKKFPISNGVNQKQWKAITDQREFESITAEFTPRVRLAHPNFTRAALRPLITKSPQMALPVRVTGILMFDSQHFIDPNRAPHRVNNWEIHPILKLEFCPKGATCKADSDNGWKSLDDL